MLLRSKPAAFNHVPMRLVFIGFGIAAFVLLFSAGATVNMSYSDAQEYSNQFLADTENIDQSGIFVNNIRIASAMFVPAFGAGFGGYSAFATGMMFKALTMVNPSIGDISPLVILATPFGILEVLACGVAMSRSAMLAFQLLKRRNDWKRFALWTAIEFALVVSALLTGAVIEDQIINNA